MITYNDIKDLKTFEERLELLLLKDYIFESPRNEMGSFYKSLEWLAVRKEVIYRDLAYDLGVDGHSIIGKTYVHHIDPITLDDLRSNSKKLLDKNNLITVSHDTHMIIHYGVYEPYVERFPGDTILW